MVIFLKTLYYSTAIAGKYVHAKYTQIDNMVNDNHVHTAST